MLNIKVIEKAELPAGKYCIGDLSHILPRDLYEDFACSFEHSNEVVLLKKGRMKAFHVFHEFTPDGDGTLADQEGREYAVDCGNLGAVELKSPSITKIAKEMATKGLVHIVEFKDPFEVFYELVELGAIYHFGNIQIPTFIDREEEEDEDYDDEDYDDDEEEESEYGDVDECSEEF